MPNVDTAVFLGIVSGLLILTVRAYFNGENETESVELELTSEDVAEIITQIWPDNIAFVRCESLDGEEYITGVKTKGDGWVLSDEKETWTEAIIDLIDKKAEISDEPDFID